MQIQLSGNFSVYFSGTQKRIAEKNGMERGWQIMRYSVSTSWWNSIALSKHFLPSSRRFFSLLTPLHRQLINSGTRSFPSGWPQMKRWKASEWKSDDLSTLYCWLLFSVFLLLSSPRQLLFTGSENTLIYLPFSQVGQYKKRIKMIANCVVLKSSQLFCLIALGAAKVWMRIVFRLLQCSSRDLKPIPIIPRESTNRNG